MVHLFLISQFIVVVFANPFQKYPYVFLLDVGNEEIGKSNTEQIRLSIPGGSLAVRYPAVGEGDTIGHVRVSGIDFGTDLKASIIQGGPGYKYAVFVFMGNPGVPYDAVVTIQTIPNIDISTPDFFPNNNNVNVNHGLEDSNDSAEDMSDNTITKAMYSGNIKSQIMQSSSNTYQYVSDDAIDADDFQNDAGSQNEKAFQDLKEDTDDDDDDDEGENYKKDDNENDRIKGDSEDSSDEDANKNKYGIYEAFKPHWFGGVRFYPQAALYTQNGIGKPISDEEDAKEELNEIRGENKYKDNNNNMNRGYGSPVEY